MQEEERLTDDGAAGVPVRGKGCGSRQAPAGAVVRAGSPLQEEERLTGDSAAGAAVRAGGRGSRQALSVERWP